MLPALDEERLRSLTRDDATLALELIDMMIEEATGLESRVRSCCGEQDRAGARAAAHSIKGVAGSVGAPALHDAAAVLETLIVNEGDWAAATALCDDVTQALRAVRNARVAHAARAGA